MCVHHSFIQHLLVHSLNRVCYGNGTIETLKTLPSFPILLFFPCLFFPLLLFIALDQRMIIYIKKSMSQVFSLLFFLFPLKQNSLIEKLAFPLSPTFPPQLPYLPFVIFRSPSLSLHHFGLLGVSWTIELVSDSVQTIAHYSCAVWVLARACVCMCGAFVL